jgi:hypothetical protein
MSQWKRRKEVKKREQICKVFASGATLTLHLCVHPELLTTNYHPERYSISEERFYVFVENIVLIEQCYLKNVLKGSFISPINYLTSLYEDVKAGRMLNLPNIQRNMGDLRHGGNLFLNSKFKGFSFEPVFDYIIEEYSRYPRNLILDPNFFFED